MKGNDGNTTLLLLIALTCVFSILVLAIQIAQGQEHPLITLKDAIDIALETNLDLQRSSNQVASTAISMGQSNADAQTLSVEAAEKGITSARSGYWPSLSLFAEIGSGYHRPSQYGDFSDQVLDINPNARIGLSLSIPLFDHSVTSSSVQKAHIQLANKQLNLEDLRQTVSSEVQQALFDDATAPKELEASQVQREYARRHCR